MNDLTNKLEICDVDVVFTAQSEGVLSHNASKQDLCHFILCNEILAFCCGFEVTV